MKSYYYIFNMKKLIVIICTYVETEINMIIIDILRIFILL